MSKVVRVKDGNYKIVVDNPSDVDGGTITLDTTGGYTTDRGTVVVTGDLEVKGITTTVESTVTTIADNIITVNSGQQGAGISASLQYKAGLEIDRGSSPTARILFDESVPFSTGGQTGFGSFIFENNAEQFLPLAFNSVNTTSGDLYITTPTGGINVSGTVDYEENVLNYIGGVVTDGGSGVINNPDYLPNAQAMVDYVDYAVSNANYSIIYDNDTSVETLDFDTTGNESKVIIKADNTTVAEFFTNRAVFSDLQIIGNEISTNDYVSNEDLVLSANGTGVVKIKDVIEITETPGDDDFIVDPIAPDNGIRLYSKPQAGGNTGIFFVNKDNTQDEIISRNRALVYSMLF